MTHRGILSPTATVTMVGGRRGEAKSQIADKGGSRWPAKATHP